MKKVLLYVLIISGVLALICSVFFLSALIKFNRKYSGYSAEWEKYEACVEKKCNKEQTQLCPCIIPPYR